LEGVAVREAVGRFAIAAFLFRGLSRGQNRLHYDRDLSEFIEGTIMDPHDVWRALDGVDTVHHLPVQ
jgi:hypothetical protein